MWIYEPNELNCVIWMNRKTVDIKVKIFEIYFRAFIKDTKWDFRFYSVEFQF